MAELREMSYAECRTHLANASAGRVAVSTPDGPHIVPVNFSVVDESIVFRTSPFSVLATYGRNAKLAFEVDFFDAQRQLGWSVVARGRADVVTDPEDLSHIRQVWAPTPWADGVRNLHLRLTWQELSGRCLGLLDASTTGDVGAEVAATG